ncbi:hypothetical protein Taro_044237 [Colocasia esculenta]|uniref:Uncharacterized protein n=1 Tax=Colocasia esculenta TaxID=4460 RepID=A0A843X576_COLES|nr:hypothetical protein [Colocasia esculenta]
MTDEVNKVMSEDHGIDNRGSKDHDRHDLEVSSGAQNQRHTSAKCASDGIHRLGHLGSLFGEKHLRGHLGLSRPMLHLQ